MVAIKVTLCTYEYWEMSAKLYDNVYSETL